MFGSSVAVVAGRRIDAPGATTKHFPQSEEGRVYRELQARFRSHKVHEIVCSAACGTDILALEAAQSLALGSTIVLPSPAECFRASSVVDRGGNWGLRFDRLIEAATRSGTLRILPEGRKDDADYLEANTHILAIAQLSQQRRRFAFVAWDERPREGTDVTEDFLLQAMHLGFTADVISTLPTEL